MYLISKLADCELKDLICGEIIEEIVSGYICEKCNEANTTTIRKIFNQIPKYIFIFLDRKRPSIFGY
jgi:hypothetical protein